jgi:hypothetical protein
MWKVLCGSRSVADHDVGDAAAEFRCDDDPLVASVRATRADKSGVVAWLLPAAAV